MCGQVIEIIRINKRSTVRATALVSTALVLSGLQGCSYDTLERQDEDARAAWSDVLNQYQRRAELIPNLVRTAKKYADHQLQISVELTEVTARQASSIQLTPELVNNPGAFAQFQATQKQLSDSLKNLFTATEGFPQLQADANFRDLQVALEQTQTRIAVARNHYVDAVRNYNFTVRAFPSSLTAKVFDFGAKPSFSAQNEQAISQAQASPAQTADFGDTAEKGAAAGKLR
jgi:LemA protein